jgi:hypothetical protein
MKPHIDDTWWKRLFTVLEFGVGGIIGLYCLYVFFTQPGFNPDKFFFKLIYVIAIPVAAIHLIKVGICYIVEGPTPPKPRIKPPQNPPSN